MTILFNFNTANLRAMIWNHNLYNPNNYFASFIKPLKPVMFMYWLQFHFFKNKISASRMLINK